MIVWNHVFDIEHFAIDGVAARYSGAAPTVRRQTRLLCVRLQTKDARWSTGLDVSLGLGGLVVDDTPTRRPRC